MRFQFIYEPSEYPRIINAVIIDARASIPAIANAVGVAIKAYVDVEVAKVSAFPDNRLFFRIETIIVKPNFDTNEGVLAGYFSLVVGGKARLEQFQLRPNFYPFTTQISAEIVNFINSGDWRQYKL